MFRYAFYNVKNAVLAGPSLQSVMPVGACLYLKKVKRLRILSYLSHTTHTNNSSRVHDVCAQP